MSQAVYSEKAHAAGGNSMAEAAYLDFKTQSLEVADARWSPRQTLLFVTGSSLLLWSLIGLGLYGLL